MRGGGHRMLAGAGQREGRHRNRSRLQGPSCQHRAQCGARTPKLWDHDLSWSQRLTPWITQAPQGSTAFTCLLETLAFKAQLGCNRGSPGKVERSCVGFLMMTSSATRHTSAGTRQETTSATATVWLQLHSRPQARIPKWELPSWVQSSFRTRRGNNEVTNVVFTKMFLYSERERMRRAHLWVGKAQRERERIPS